MVFAECHFFQVRSIQFNLTWFKWVCCLRGASILVHEDDAPSVLHISCMQMPLEMKILPGTSMEKHTAEKLDHFILS